MDAKRPFEAGLYSSIADITPSLLRGKPLDGATIPANGTYSFKDGWYSEMGREAIKDAIVWVDKTTTKGTWMKRHDIWKKVTLPDKVVKYILDCCKTKNTPADIQQMIKQSMFK